jgi:hypothetical protein
MVLKEKVSEGVDWIHLFQDRSQWCVCGNAWIAGSMKGEDSLNHRSMRLFTDQKDLGIFV